MPAIAPSDDVVFLFTSNDAGEVFTLADGVVDGHRISISVNQEDSIGDITIDIVHLSTTGSSGTIVAASGSPAGSVLVWNQAAGYWNIVSIIGFGVV